MAETTTMIKVSVVPVSNKSMSCSCIANHLNLCNILFEFLLEQVGIQIQVSHRDNQAADQMILDTVDMALIEVDRMIKLLKNYL